MNIILLGHHDIASLYALNRVIALLPDHRYHVFLSGELRSSNSASAGPLGSLAQADAALCASFLAGTAGEVAPALHEDPMPAIENPNSPDGLAALRESQPDLVVSIRYRRIFKDAAIAVPRYGVLNLHSGILPDYRGVMATFWALLNEEAEVGATLHWIIDSGIDTGPIIDVFRRPSRPDRSYLSNVLGLYAAGCNAIATAVRAIDAGETIGTRASARGGDYFSAPASADIDRFIAKGLSFVDGEELQEIRPPAQAADSAQRTSTSI